MKSTRLMIVFCACLAAVALWPADAAAQRGGGRGGGGAPAQRRQRRRGQRGGGGGGGGSRSQAVPRTHPPVVNGGHNGRITAGTTGPTTADTTGPTTAGTIPTTTARSTPASALASASASHSGFYAPTMATQAMAGAVLRLQLRATPIPTRTTATMATGRRPGSKSSRATRRSTSTASWWARSISSTACSSGSTCRPASTRSSPTRRAISSYRQRTLFRPGETLSLQGNPRAAAAGRAGRAGAAAVRERDPDPNPGSLRDPRDPYYGRDPYGTRTQPARIRIARPPPPDDRGRTMPMPERPGEHRAPDSSSFGTLNIRVQPGDAVVVIDGERWDSPEGRQPPQRSSCRPDRTASKCARTASSRTCPRCRSVPATRRR